MLRKKWAAVLVPMLAMTLLTTGTVEANFVTNGNFETTSGYGQLGYNTTVSGWTNQYSSGTTYGYNFIFNASNAANGTGVTGASGSLQLWGPGNGSSNGLAASPDGGNFIAGDGVYDSAAITQTLHGLTQGLLYTVGFYYAGAQQSTYNGTTTEGWTVSFGNSSASTVMIANANHGFTGWVYQTFNFVADNANEVLSFLALGTPSGEPPFTLLDGVSVNVAVPEPSSLLLIGIGLIGFGAARLRRRSRTPVL